MDRADSHYSLGIDLGTTFSAAAVHSAGRTGMVTIGHRSIVVPSSVFVTDSGAAVTANAALRRGAAEPERLARHFKRRVGDSVPLILGGMPITAEWLSAQLLRWIVDRVVEQRGERPASIAVTHPANWGSFKRERMADIVRQADIGEVTLLSEPEAAARSYAATERVPAGQVVAVYDLGGGTFDASVLRKVDGVGGFEVLGAPSGVEHLGGIDVDEAVFAHVSGSLGAAFTGLPADEATLRAVDRLRSDCVEAKEALSSDVQVSVPVLLPGLHTEVRLTRRELEAMVRPLLQQSVAALQRTIASAGLEAGDVDRVLLVGGSSRVPLVAELVTEALGRPFFVDAHPKHATALGAALAASGLAAAGPAVGASGVAAPDVAESAVPAPPAGETPATGAAAFPPPAPLSTASGLPPAGRSPGGARRWLVAVAALAVVALVGLVAAARAGTDGDDTQTLVPTSPQSTTETTRTPTTSATTEVTTTEATPTTTPPAPEPLAVVDASASASAADNFDACEMTTTYGAGNAVDGDPGTAWRAEGDATGQSLTFDLGGTRRVRSVGLVPGYDKVDPCDGTDRWAQNRRPTVVTWIFDDGTEHTQTLIDERGLQPTVVDVQTGSITVRIDGVTPSPERDYTAISEVVVMGL